MWKNALILFSRVPEAAVAPNQVSFSAAISACEKNVKWRMALLLFSCMPIARVLSDVISFSAAISAFEKGCQWQMALFLFWQMSEARVVPDLVSFNASISACESSGGQKSSYNISMMPSARLVPDICQTRCRYQCL